MKVRKVYKVAKDRVGRCANWNSQAEGPNRRLIEAYESSTESSASTTH